MDHRRTRVQENAGVRLADDAADAGLQGLGDLGRCIARPAERRRLPSARRVATTSGARGARSASDRVRRHRARPRAARRRSRSCRRRAVRPPGGLVADAELQQLGAARGDHAGLDEHVGLHATAGDGPSNRSSGDDELGSDRHGRGAPVATTVAIAMRSNSASQARATAIGSCLAPISAIWVLAHLQRAHRASTPSPAQVVGPPPRSLRLRTISRRALAQLARVGFLDERRASVPLRDALLAVARGENEGHPARCEQVCDVVGAFAAQIDVEHGQIAVGLVRERASLRRRPAAPAMPQPAPAGCPGARATPSPRLRPPGREGPRAQPCSDLVLFSPEGRARPRRCHPRPSGADPQWPGAGPRLIPIQLPFSADLA